MAEIGVSIIVVLLCGILTMIKYWKVDKIKKCRVSTLSEIVKIKKCGNLSIYTDLSTFAKNGQNQALWKSLYIETFPDLKKMAEIGVSIIVSIPQCPTHWQSPGYKKMFHKKWPKLE